MKIAQPESPFPLEEYNERFQRVREQIIKREMDILLVSSPENIYYLTGYQTAGYYAYQCLMLPLESEPFLIVRRLEATNVTSLSWIQDVVTIKDTDDPIAITHRALADRGLADSRIGLELENWFLTAKTYLRLTDALPNAQLIDGSGTVEAARLIKSPREIEKIRRAVKIAQEGIRAGGAAIREGATENDIAAEIYRAAILNGSEYMSLPPFVASGLRSTRAHATWDGRIIRTGDVLILELSGVVARYSGAIMRTAVVGEPNAEVYRRAKVAIEALTRAIDAMHPGATSGEIDHACRGTIAAAGLEVLFQHRTGYSIGLNFPPDWGEGQIMSLREGDSAVLRPGMVFHLVPVLLDVGRYGVGFSETVLVTESGHEVLTSRERELIVC